MTFRVRVATRYLDLCHPLNIQDTLMGTPVLQ